MRHREIDDELRFHLDMRVRDYVARGFSREEAERIARERFGHVEQVRHTLQSHDARRERMSRVWQDGRLALRGFRRSPTFTITTVVILGVGIGVAAAMWAVCSAVLVRPFPVADQDRIVQPSAMDAAGVDVGVKLPELESFGRSSRTMRQLAGFAHWAARPAAFLDGDQAINLRQVLVTGNFFNSLGARPLLGRLLGPGDDSTSHVVVLSYGAWKRQFGGDRAIVGHRLTDPYLGIPTTIVGVAPPGLDYPIGVDCWVPLWGPGIDLDVVARLAPGASMVAARSEFLTAVKAMMARRPEVPITIVAADIRTLRDAVVGDIRPTVVVLTAAVALLLLIACVNVGNLFLLRATTRGRELAVRRALGATVADVLRQLLVESIILAIAGSALGLAVAEIARRILVAAAPPEIPNLDVVRTGGAPIGAAATVALLAVLLFGIGPALVAARRHPASPLRLDARSGTATRQRRRVRQLLVAAQVALALVMLAGAGLLARSLARLETLNLGYRPDHLIELDVVFNYSRIDTTLGVNGMYDKLAPHLRALPGVTSLTAIEIPPFYGPNVFTSSWDVEGRTDEQMGASPMVPIETGGTEYFRTLGIPILHGRGFTEADREKAPRVAVVSQSVAHMFWPGQDPIGKRLRFRHDTVWRTVVGIAGDIHYRTLRTATPTVFLPFRQFFWQGSFILRTTTSAGAILPTIRRAVTAADPNAAVWRASSMDDLIAAPMAASRLSAMLLSTFGLVALLLASVGLYGVMASAVREQTRDIGVRMALGATPQRVRGEVLRRAMLVSVGGAAVGVIGALAGARVIASLLFEVNPTDPVALVGACAVLLGVAALAAYLPAYRASRVDPARALQTD